MSETTNLKLFKHDNPSTNTNLFDVERALNDNWDKIDEDIGKKIYYYDNVQEMKNDEGLKEGMVCQTLGYHSVNDGGSGLYQIIAAPLVEADEGSIHVLMNGLRAKLIINDSINVKQFGAYGDRVHDDTNAIQNTIDFLYNQISSDLINNCFLYNNVIEITEGIYKITDTIDFPNILKLSIIGNIQLVISVDNKTALYINSRGLNSINTPFHSKQMFVGGKMISAKGGGALTIRQEPYVYDFNKFINNESTSIGIEFGDRTGDTSVIKTSRMCIADINISGFNTGLAINTVNVYCDTFENVHVERNNNSIVWGNNSFANSGERITFKNCIFAACIRGLHAKQPFDTMLFDNCSVDFVQNFAYVERGNGQILFKGGHIEGVGATDVPNAIKNMLGYGYICYYNNTIDSSEKLNFIIDGTTSYVDESITNNNVTRHKFGTSRDSTAWATGRNLNVVIDNYLIKWWQNKFPFSSEAVFLADENTNIYFKSNTQKHGKEPYFGSSNIDIEGQFGLYTSDDFFTQNSQYIWKNENTDEIHVYNDSTKLSSDLTPYFTTAIRLTKNTNNNSKPGLSKRYYSVKSRHMRVLLIYKLTNVNTQASDYYERPSLVFGFRGENNLNLGTLYTEFESSKIINSINENGWKCVILNVEIPASCNNIIFITEFGIYSNSSYQNWTGNVNIGGLLVDFY